MSQSIYSSYPSPLYQLDSSIIQSQQPNFSIEYKENLTNFALLDEIKKIPNPQVLFWYIGSYGLKEDGVKFYSDLLKNILDGENNAACWLCDLTAWGAFHNSKAQITSSNRCAEEINKFNLNKLKCIKTADLFAQMRLINDSELIEFFKSRIVSHEFLKQTSASFAETRIKLGEVFKNNCPIFETIFEQDSAKCYSVVQYFEGLFIINYILEKILKNDRKDINIIFALPNDESKYYKDDKNSFLNDLENFLKKIAGNSLTNKRINISFFNFKYGEADNSRPYNSGKKVLKTIHLEQILASSTQTN